MVLRSIALAGVIALPLGTAFACGGGGGTAASEGTVKSWAKSASVKPLNISRDVVKALSLAKKYQDQAIREGDTTQSHEKAAYQWGYEVGNPSVIASIRLGGEISQAVYYTVDLMLPWTDDPGYRSLSWDGEGGIKDSFGDISQSALGALDRSEGRPSKYSK